jgi:flagellar assembly protein FliH
VSAEKWQAPQMSADPSKVLRYRQENEKSAIPTANDIEQWRKQAEEEGYREGIQRAEQDNLLSQQRLLDLIDFFEHPLRLLNEDIENQLTQLAVTLAQQLVRRELKIEPGEIIGLIRDSVKLLPGNSRNISIKLHPDDAELVKSALSIDTSDEEHSWKLVEDPMITRGGCEIKSAPSTINATLENRLSALAASVLGGEREKDE